MRGKYVAAIIFLLIGAMALGGYLEFKLSKKLEAEFSTPSRIAKKIRHGFGAVFLQDRPSTSVKRSNRLDVSLTEFFVPLELTSGGGGVAADGVGGLLVLDLEGRIYRFVDGDLHQIDVTLPDSHVNGLRRQLKNGELGNASVRFGQFRFNDLLVYTHDTRSYLLVSYSEWHEDRRCSTSTLAKAPLTTPDPEAWQIERSDWEIVARTDPCLPPNTSGFAIQGAEAGGRMVETRDGAVLWTAGAYGRDDDFDRAHPETALAQNDATDYGKVLRVDIERNTVTHFARGLRNPQGIDLTEEGTPLVTDHGMRGGDELNRITPGANFGFPFVTLGTKYSREPGGLLPVYAGHEGYDPPLVAFVPSIAPSSVLVVRDFHPNWDGDILIGGLKRQLHRVHMEGGRVLFVEPFDLGLRIRDMAQIGAGRIALFTDDKKIVMMSPETAPSSYQRLRALIDETPDPDLRVATQDAAASCLQCHSLEEGEQASGPSLHGVCGRKPGNEAFANYSGALGAVGSVWDEESLARFIADPEGAAPGTTMAAGPLERPGVAKDLAAALCGMTTTDER